MTKEEVQVYEKNLRNASAYEIVAFAVRTFDNALTFSTSFSFEDQAVTYLLSQQTKQFSIFTLDTGRLFQETYDIWEKTEKHFGVSIQPFFPDRTQVEQMINTHGINLFYNSVENRKLCCQIRKTFPLQRALQEKKGWLTGLRREQSVTRYGMKKIEWDETNQIVKINPLADWTETQTIEFVKSMNIPYNPLQEKGYRSIGCLPCTKPIGKDDDIRAGRWWWESAENKECGLHK